MSAHGQHSGVCGVMTPCHVSRCTATTAPLEEPEAQRTACMLQRWSVGGISTVPIPGRVVGAQSTGRRPFGSLTDALLVSAYH